MQMTSESQPEGPQAPPEAGGRVQDHPGSASRGLKRWWLARLAGKVCVGLVLLLVIAEFSLRAAQMDLPARPATGGLAALRMQVPRETAPYLWETWAPGTQGEVVYPAYGRVPARSVRYQISRQGLRDREYAIPKPPEVLRIAMVGDSVTYGTGVAVEDSLPKQLEARLAARFPEVPIEVLNCGVEATNTSQQVALMRYRLLAFQPDLWLWCVTIPDASGKNVERPSEWGELPAQVWIQRLGLTSGRWEDVSISDPRIARTMFFRRHSVLADRVANLVHARLRSQVLLESYRRDWAPQSPGFRQVQRSLRTLAEGAVLRGWRVRVAMYPTLTQLGENYPFADEADRLAKTCEGLGLPFLHLLEPLLGYPAAALHAHPHDRHPNAHCHGLVADFWADDLAPAIEAILAAREN